MTSKAHKVGEYIPMPEQEPVAFFDPQEKGFYWAKPTKITAPTIVDVEPLALYTQRTWVGLTNKEILADDVLRYYFGLNGGGGPVSKSGRKIVDAIEAKLKEKNT